MADATVLVVDDAVEQIQLIHNVLRDRYRVVFATGGPDALRIARESAPDLILLDVMMPGMSGFEVCAALKEDPRTREIPVLFLTASDAVTDEERGLELGAVDYVTKPINPPVLRKRLDTHRRLQEATARLRDQNAELEDRVRSRTAELAATNQAMSRFVPDPFLRVIGRERIQGVRLGDHGVGEMTVMFVDIHDCTRRISAMTAPDSFAFVNAFFGRISPTLREHGGIVVKYTGDGVMALFPSGARAACQAAVQVSRDVREGLSEDPPLSVGVGLATGPVMVGVVGEASRLQADAMSDTVNLSNRLEGLTRHYGVRVVLGEKTLAALGDDHALHPRYLDRVRVKGRDRPLRVYELYDADPEPVFDAKLRSRALQDDGWRHFYDRRFGEAVKCFTDALEVLPGDTVCRRVLRRAATHLLEGVEDDWDGVTMLLTK